MPIGKDIELIESLLLALVCPLLLVFAEGLTETVLVVDDDVPTPVPVPPKDTV